MITGCEEIVPQLHKTIRKLQDDGGTFMPGRRNDDMFDWALCVLALEADEKDATLAKMNRLYNMMPLSASQHESLDDWERDPRDMFSYMVNSYFHFDRNDFANLWIDNDIAENPFE